jgi:iron complex transport system substrate-binding protein
MRFLRSSLLAFTALAGLAFPALAQDEVTPFADPSRLVAIGGSLLEILYALGEEGKLVARDTTGVYPPEAMALPDVGYMRALSPEGVLAVNPSALLVVEGSGPPETLDVLAKGSVPYVTVPDDFSHEGVLTKVRTVGAALGVADKAEALATELDQQMQAAEAATKDIPEPERQKVLFVISAQDGKIRAAGTGTAANGIIELAGAINPLAEMHGYQTLSDEAILTANPDVVLFMNNTGATDFVDKLKANPALAATPRSPMAGS